MPENWTEMIAFEYNAFYNNSLVCMKFKTAGFPNRIFKKYTLAYLFLKNIMPSVLRFVGYF